MALLLLLSSQLYLWCSPFLVRLLRMWQGFFLSNHRGSHIPSSWTECAGCVFVASYQQDMNIRIFWVSVMQCRCAQIGPQFILSSERVVGNGVRAHDNSKGKFPLLQSSEQGQTHDAASCRIVSPTHYQLRYSGPKPHGSKAHCSTGNRPLAWKADALIMQCSLPKLCLVSIFHILLQTVWQCSERPLNTSALPSFRSVCDVCCAHQSIWPFISSDSGMSSRAVDPLQSFKSRYVHSHLPVRALRLYSQTCIFHPYRIGKGVTLFADFSLWRSVGSIASMTIWWIFLSKHYWFLD